MKTKKLITIIVIIIIVGAIALRLIANKKSFDAELKAVSEFNAVVPVITDTVKELAVSDGFSINGTFSAIHEVNVVSETQGKVTSIEAETGNHVNAGQTLAQTDNELAVAQFQLAKANFDKAEKDMKSYELLSKSDAVSKEQYETSKLAYVNAQSDYVAARKQMENSVIKAPIEGTVTRRYIEKGTFVSPGMQVFDIVETGKVKLLAKLTADELNEIHANQQVKVQVDGIEGTSFEGRVNAISVQADASKRYEVEIVVDNRSNQPIKPGMFGTAYFSEKTPGKTLVIPRKALTGSLKNPNVFVVQGDSVIQKQIAVESLTDQQIAVKEGLKAGDVIVVSGQINLSNGVKIKVN